jgi:hypothetical protein
MNSGSVRRPLVVSCGSDDGVTKITPSMSKVWKLWAFLGTVVDIMFPKRDDDWAAWYDVNHPKGFTAGSQIVGPLVAHVLEQFPKDREVQIAVIGDSTTAYCTQYSQPGWDWKPVPRLYEDWSCPKGSDWRSKTDVHMRKNGAARRRAGLREYLAQTEHKDRKVSVQYYAVSGASLSGWEGGFLQQLGCALTDRDYDALVIVGGWNNRKTVSDKDIKEFETMLSGSSAEAQQLIGWHGESGYRQKMVAKHFPENTAYPIAG